MQFLLAWDHYDFSPKCVVRFLYFSIMTKVMKTFVQLILPKMQTSLVYSRKGLICSIDCISNWLCNNTEQRNTDNTRYLSAVAQGKQKERNES